VVKEQPEHSVPFVNIRQGPATTRAKTLPDDDGENSNIFRKTRDERG
jgi:hypothetical protein